MYVDRFDWRAKEEIGVIDGEPIIDIVEDLEL